MKTILAVTDFSDAADHAVDYACNLANKLYVENFYLLNTYENVPLYDSGEAGSLALTLQQADELEQTRVEEFKLLKKRVVPTLNSSVNLFPLIVNEPLPDAVNRICEEEDVDLVIMGAKPKDEIETLLVGSAIQKAIDKIEFPVLLLPICAPITIPEKIILATDFKEPLSKTILFKLHKFLQRFNASVLAIHKCPKGHLNEKEMQLATDLQLQLQNYKCELHIVQGMEDLPTTVNNFAKNSGASMVISMHKMRGFLSALFHKSLTKSLAWRSNVPLLVLHM